MSPVYTIHPTPALIAERTAQVTLTVTGRWTTLSFAALSTTVQENCYKVLNAGAACMRDPVNYHGNHVRGDPPGQGLASPECRPAHRLHLVLLLLVGLSLFCLQHFVAIDKPRAMISSKCVIALGYDRATPYALDQAGTYLGLKQTALCEVAFENSNTLAFDV